MEKTSDTFGRALLDWVDGGNVAEIIERDDGQIEMGAGPDGYLTSYRDWPYCEHRAIHYATGRVIDVGSGSGRVSLYLQDNGVDVAAVDVSPLAVKAARRNGVRTVWRRHVDNLSQEIGEFDTILLFGNNLGVFGTPDHAKTVLTQWATLVRPGTRLLIQSTNPYSGGAPIVDRAYCDRNREAGRALGQCVLRLWYNRQVSDWFSWFFVSSSELQKLLRQSGWRYVRTISSDPSEPYVALFETRATK